MALPDTAILHTHERQREETRAPAALLLAVPWHRAALGGILLLALVLNTWDLARLGYGNDYYAAAVRSMMQSWHNFFFNSFDPGGFVTIDKPPLGFWFQVLSARLFGYNGISLLLPSVVSGLLSVFLLYRLVGRIFGHGAGLLAALAMAVAPVAVATNRSNIVDSILVLFLLLAAGALSVATERGSLRWLMLCAVLVGLGFNIKMLEAYLVVPALGVVYLLGAPIRWWKRLVHLILAGIVMLAVSLSWAVAVDLTPASQRPWVDSTTTNSELDLAIGYNGLQRLTGQGGPGGRGGPPGGFGGAGQLQRSDIPLSSMVGGAQSGSSSSGNASSGSGMAGTPRQGGATSPSQPGAGAGSATGGATLTGGPGAPSVNGGAAPNGFAGGPPGGGPGGGGPGGGGGLFGTGQPGPWRLFEQGLGGQVSWLLPLALIGLLVAAVRRRVRLPLDRQQQGVLLWGVWLLTVAAFFSVAGFFHPYYLVTLAPPVAALSGIGLATLWQEYHLRTWLGWLLPPALLASAAVQVVLLQPYPDWSRWLDPPVLGLGIAGAAVLVLARLRRGRIPRRWTPFAAAVGVLALLLAPTTWAAATATSGGGGMTPSAGPSGFGGPGFGGGGAGPTSGGVERGNFVLGGQGRAGAGVPGQERGGASSFPLDGAMPAGPGGGPGNDGDAAGNSGLLRYLEQHQGTTKYLVAVQDSNTAASFIIQTGKPVMSLGGFSGNDPILTLDGLEALIKNNTVRYVMGLGGRGSDNGIAAWVQSACSAVPASAYGGSSGASSAGGFPAGGTQDSGAGAPSGMPGAGSGRTPNAGAPANGGAGTPATGVASQGGMAGFGGGGPGGFGGNGQQLYDCVGAVK